MQKQEEQKPFKPALAENTSNSISALLFILFYFQNPLYNNAKRTRAPSQLYLQLQQWFILRICLEESNVHEPGNPCERSPPWDSEEGFILNISYLFYMCGEAQVANKGWDHPDII